MAGGRVGQKLEDRQGGDRFAGPGFADQCQGLALAEREGHALDRMGDGGTLMKIDRQIVDDEKRLAHHLNVFRGSKASRTASPTKTSSDSISETTTKLVMPSQGARRLLFPCAISSPSEGDPGGRPKPRKSSDVRVTIEAEAMKGMKVNVATMALGRMCLNMILPSERPRARAD